MKYLAIGIIYFFITWAIICDTIVSLIIILLLIIWHLKIKKKWFEMFNKCALLPLKDDFEKTSIKDYYMFKSYID